MQEHYNFVTAILHSKITIECNEKLKEKILKSIGAHRSFIFSKCWHIAYASTEELAIILQNLRDSGFIFLGGGYGWPPSAVFCELRERKMVHGTVKTMRGQVKGKLIFVNQGKGKIDPEYLKKIGARRTFMFSKYWYIPYNTPDELANILERIQYDGFGIISHPDPIMLETIKNLRNIDKTQQTSKTITYRGRNKYIIFEE